MKSQSFVYADSEISAKPFFKIGVTEIDSEAVNRLVCSKSIEAIPLKGNKLAVASVSNGEETSLNELPNNLIGFIALSEESFAYLKQISEHWELHGHSAPPACLLITKNQEQNILNEWLIDQITTQYIKTASRNVKLMREAAQLRIDHDETQSAFRALERYADANFDLKRQQALVLEPFNQAIRLDPQNNSVTQLIPTVSVGISDISLYIAETPDSNTGELTLTLNTLESGEQLAKWAAPTRSIVKGWMRFALSECLGVDEQSLSLTAQWTGGGIISISMALSHPDPKWCASVNGKITNRALAMKVWRGLPRTSPVSSSISQNFLTASTRRWLVDNDCLKGVENITGPDEIVQYIEALQAVLVHPMGANASLGRLKNSAPAGGRHIYATVENGNNNAGRVEFAIAVADMKVNISNPNAIAFKPGHLSDWVTLAGGESSEVHLFLPEPLKTQADIYLATRVVQGSSTEYCWAYFKKIRVSA